MKKENAVKNWTDMIKKSWTWAKLTEEEKTKFLKFINKNEIAKGSYNARWAILQCCYDVFLIGLDYKPIGWRE